MEMFNLYVDLTHINTQCVLIFLYMVYNVWITHYSFVILIYILMDCFQIGPTEVNKNEAEKKTFILKVMGGSWGGVFWLLMWTGLLLRAVCRLIVASSYLIYNELVLCCRKALQTGCQLVSQRCSHPPLHESPPGGTLSARGCYKQLLNCLLHIPCSNITQLKPPFKIMATVKCEHERERKGTEIS